MSKSKKNSNQKSQKNITISEIMNTENGETTIPRDILRFITPKIKDLLQNFSVIESKVPQLNELSDIDKMFKAVVDDGESISSFRVRELVNWLMVNNRDFIYEFQGSPINKSGRSHKKTPYVVARINKLVELDLLLLKKNKVQSRRNAEIKTYVYDVTSKGAIIALTLDLKNYDKSSDEYKKILKVLLNEWLNFVPIGYKDPYNYYYHFIENVLEECLTKHEDIVLFFIDTIREYHNSYDINFSELRHRINNVFFRKIIHDAEFKSLFFNLMHELNILKRLRISTRLDEQEGFIVQKQQFLKIQFKIDIENQIDKSLTANLKQSSIDKKKSLWSKRPENSGKTMGEAYNRVTYPYILKENILDFSLKTMWDQARNENVGNATKISLMIRCSICDQIYPYLFEFEKEIFENIECRSCNSENMVTLE